MTLGTITSTLASQISLKNGASAATATIAASDPITVTLTGPTTVDEGDATTNYTVSLTPTGVLPTAALTVSYATANGTALAGTDYTAKTGTLTFTQAPRASQTFTVQTTDDTLGRGDGRDVHGEHLASPSGRRRSRRRRLSSTAKSDDDDHHGRRRHADGDRAEREPQQRG